MAGNKKLKIGILTFWWSADNYGQLLQCYALQKYLRDAGHDAFLVRYNPQGDYARTSLLLRFYKAFNPVKLCRFLKFKLNQRKSAQEQKLHDRHFDDFRNKYIVQSEKIYSSYLQLKENPPEADVYIVGSDQVWNFSFYAGKVSKCKNVIHSYFLDFGKSETKRVSYAASWGQTSLEQDIIEEITPLLRKFDFVSVREESGIALCKKCGYENAQVRCDPTLLLSAENYRALYKAENAVPPKNPYLFLYMLNNTCDFDIADAYKFAKDKNLEVVYVTGNSKIDYYPKKYATIPEWLCLLDNAEYVITNSFHCTLFSLLFKKKVGVVPLSGTVSGMNSRLETLFKMFGVGKRWLKDDFSIFDEVMNPILNVKTDFNVEEKRNG